MRPLYIFDSLPVLCDDYVVLIGGPVRNAHKGFLSGFPLAGLNVASKSCERR